MSEFDFVQIISLSGFLILAISALAAHRLSWRKGIAMALLWGAIFTGVALLFALVGN